MIAYLPPPKTPRFLKLRSKAAELLLMGFMAQASRKATAQEADPTLVRSALRDILSRAEFHPISSSAPNPVVEKIKQFFSHIYRAIQRIWHWIMQHTQMHYHSHISFISRTVVYVLVGLLVLLGAWLLWRLARHVRWAGRQRKKNAPSSMDLEEENAPLLLPEAELLIKQGQQMAKEGNFRAALRFLFLAVLKRLDEAQVIAYERNRTNAEYLRMLRARQLPSLYEMMASLVRDFDLFWYGQRPATEEVYHRSLQSYYSLLNQLAALRSYQKGPLEGLHGT